VSVIVTNPDSQSATLSSGFTYHSVDLYWSEPSSTRVPIAGYNVYRALASAGPFAKLNGSVLVANTIFSDETVQGATTYYYQVRSVGTSGTESSPAGPVRATLGP
jgi:predicted phage tail protein